MASSESTNTPSRGASTPPSIQPSSSRASSPTHSGAATHTSTHSSAVSYTPMQAIGHPGTTAYASIQAGATVYTVRHPGTAAYIPMQSGATSYTPMQSGNAAYTPMQPGTAAYIPIYPGSMTYYSAQPGAAVNHVQSNAASPSSSSSPSRRPPTTAISFISASTSNRPGAGAASRQSGSTSFSKQSGGGSSSKQSGGGSSSLQSGGVISSRQFGGGSSSRQSGGDPSSRQSSGVSSSRQSGGVSSSRQLGAGSSSRQLIAAVSDAEEYTHTGNGPRWVDRHYDFILDYLAIGSNRKDLFGSDQKIPVGTKVKSSIQHWDVFAKSFNDNFAQFNLSGKTLRQRFGRYKARYESALRESERTGFGLTEADIARGIQTIQQLLDSLCYGFQRMNNYFWHTPGINPVSRAITGIDGLNMRLPKPRMRSSNRVEDDNDYNHNHGADSYAGSEYGESHPIAQAQPTVRDNNQYDNSFDMTSDGDLYDGFDASEDVDLPDNNGDADYIIEVNDDAQGSHHSEESDDEAPGLMQINEDAESDDCVESFNP
ncbi:hypothetical protein BGZ99_001827 [Dissophora globulifera]|uniref:Uncharacterized protein n=1 Tax=Dissophora globulifera TaxID=979702 RepID=A0A9P6UJM9_9FUNG|nr:hypothetical protein BGZ99_001827 [Dissophora globulifera]